ncbi:MAG: protein kinase [Candidatus Acidiferrum sp.]
MGRREWFTGSFQTIISAHMPLAPGTLLGPYEISAPLGAGGMGEVYRARDTRLDRNVAIKILPAQFSNDLTRKQRFQREAKTISSLNHPHICVLYDLGHQEGIDYLVMECIEGETLAERLQRGPLPLEQVLKYGAQIADALDRAHRNGVVHRDLKPGNIMLTATGSKLLDFGLAKPSALLATGATLTAATQQSPVTEQGTVVGTFQYMSPEQIEGKELDGRSDIFSFGAVLYEALTGQRAFQGKSQLSVASAILEKDPSPISSLKPMTPPALEHAIRRCLAKDREERWQTARDLALEFRWIAEMGTQAGIPASAEETRKSWRWIALSALILLGVALAVNAWLYWGRKRPVGATVRFQIALPAHSANFTLSPDGQELAIVAPGPDGRNAVWVRTMDSLVTRVLPGTENVTGPPVFWSPDSRFIAFQAGTKLKKIYVSGGPPQPICDIPDVVLGGDWNREDTIIVGTNGKGLMQVPAGGGVASLLTTTGGRNEIHAFPSFLSDGRHFVYLRAPQNPGIYAGELDVKPEQQSFKQILSTTLMAYYTSSDEAGVGWMLFMREGSLLAQPFDERRIAMKGDPVPVADQVDTFLLSANFSASRRGVLAYRRGKPEIQFSGLGWYDRQGKELGVAGEPGTYGYVDLALSPDGRRVAATRISPKTGPSQNIWLLDLAHGLDVPFTFDLSPDGSPIWSPDGERVAFSATRSGGVGIYAKAANGAGKEQMILGASSYPKYSNDWSSDGHFLLYTQQDPKTNADLWVLPLAGDGTSTGVPTPIANTEFNEGQGQFSPDTKWIAYASDESGRPEIYVQMFPLPPGGGGKIPVSRGGGNQPRWRRDGKELFYLSLDGKVMAVDVTSGPVLKLGAPRALFQAPLLSLSSEAILDVFRWDVSSDGKRFLIDSSNTSSEPLTVVLNWTEELKKK